MPKDSRNWTKREKIETKLKQLSFQMSSRKTNRIMKKQWRRLLIRKRWVNSITTEKKNWIIRITQVIWEQLMKYSKMQSSLLWKLVKRRKKEAMDMIAKSKKRKTERKLRKLFQSMCRSKLLFILDVKEFRSLVIPNHSYLVNTLPSMTMKFPSISSKIPQTLTKRSQKKNASKFKT